MTEQQAQKPQLPDFGPYNFYISPKGLQQMLDNYDSKDPSKNVVWTTDPNVELPILLTKEGTGAAMPMTCMDMFKINLARYAGRPAVADKVNGKWQFLSYEEYYDLIIKFALALIRVGITERSAVSILGFNCSRWFIDYFGAIFANCIAVGHYITNSAEAVGYVIEHSNSEIFIAENQEALNKVLSVWHKLPMLK